MRGAARLLAIVLLMLACLPCWLAAWLVRRETVWTRLFLRGVVRLLGLRVTIAGEPVGSHVLYAVNHISWLDILALGSATRTRFIAKAEIALWPVIGRLATMGGSVFVRRERRSATREQADEVAQALGGDRPVTLFAEGGTGDGMTLAPFRPALFAAAVEAGAAVQPVAVDYGARAAEIAWPEGTPFSAEMRRMLGRAGATRVTLRFQPPLDAAALDRKALAAAAWGSVAAGLGLA